ncbi:MAG: hypothetical protein BWY28_01972 [bacterium ADurb.Bin236]|nr:MAG: hypothetical protein BWY28_01972 [bacterium ADurb.Bin236]HOY61787.1 hypothetical protein [bacterium]HPN93652.1 hypothetical protein [bacterium]
MRRSEVLFLLAGLPVATLISLKLLVASSFLVIDASEGRMGRVPATIIRAFGGHKDAERMIRSVRDYRDAQYDLTGNLLRMSERFPLSDEPRISMIIEGILSEETGEMSRTHLANALSAAVGTSFSCCAAKHSDAGELIGWVCEPGEELGGGADMVEYGASQRPDSYYFNECVMKKVSKWWERSGTLPDAVERNAP